MARSAAPVQVVVAWPAPVDLRLYEGDDLYLDVAVTDLEGAPADLTGAAPEAQIRSDAESDTILADFDATIEDNVIHLHLPSTVSTGLPAAAVWDVQITDAGSITTLAAGNVSVKAEVTR